MNKLTKKLSMLVLFASLLFAGAAKACNADPIVFVHGYSGWKSQFDTMINRFQNDGTPACAMYKFGYNSLGKSNRTVSVHSKTW